MSLAAVGIDPNPAGPALRLMTGFAGVISGIRKLQDYPFEMALFSKGKPPRCGAIIIFHWVIKRYGQV